MSQLQDLFNQTSEQFIRQELGPVTRIYVDLEYLQDLRLGALMHLVKVPKEMAYILHKLPEYNKKYDYECCSHFPALKYTDEQLDELLRDPNQVDMICFKAPFTSIYYEFGNILMMIQHHNRAASARPLDIRIRLNVANPLYPDELLNTLELAFQERMQNVHFDITKEPRYTLPVNDYADNKLLLIYNIEEFVKEGSDLSVAFVSEGRFFDTRILTVPYVNKTLISDPEQYQDALTSTRAQLDLYCDFSYVPSTIPTF